jgi:hypothetical protein
MKRLYARLTKEELNFSMAGLLASFLVGVLAAMACFWLFY